MFIIQYSVGVCQGNWGVFTIRLLVGEKSVRDMVDNEGEQEYNKRENGGKEKHDGNKPTRKDDSDRDGRRNEKVDSRE